MESARSVNDIRKHARDDVATNGRPRLPNRVLLSFGESGTPLWPNLRARNEFIKRVHFFPVPFFIFHRRNGSIRIINIPSPILPEQYRSLSTVASDTDAVAISIT